MLPRFAPVLSFWVLPEYSKGGGRQPTGPLLIYCRSSGPPTRTPGSLETATCNQRGRPFSPAPRVGLIAPGARGPRQALRSAEDDRSRRRGGWGLLRARALP